MILKEADADWTSFVGPAWLGGLKTQCHPFWRRFSFCLFPWGRPGGPLKAQAATPLLTEPQKPAPRCPCFSDAEMKGKKWPQSQGPSTGNGRWRGSRKKRTEDGPGALRLDVLLPRVTLVAERPSPSPPQPRKGLLSARKRARARHSTHSHLRHFLPAPSRSFSPVSPSHLLPES